MRMDALLPLLPPQYGYNDVLLLLTKAHDIDITKADNEGKTAVEHAMACNQKKCAKLIFDHNEQKSAPNTSTHANQMPQIQTKINHVTFKEEEEEPIIKDDGDEIVRKG
eukprot:138225_1